MAEVNLEQALEELKITQETLQAQQQEIEALKTKLLYLTETEMIKTNAELVLNQKKLDELTDAHRITEKMVQNVGHEVTQIQGHVKDTLEQELTATKELIQQTQQEAENLFVGAVMAFAMSEAPEGWLECNGDEISRTEYARLFERIDVTFGEGDGETTFNLPDLRGLFVRGWDQEGLLDPEREFATGQDDQMQTHTHVDEGHSHKGITDYNGKHKHKLIFHGVQDGGNSYKGLTFSISGKWFQSSDYTKKAGKHSHNFTTKNSYSNLGEPTEFNSERPRHGNETRPKNIALLYCIKY